VDFDFAYFVVAFAQNPNPRKRHKTKTHQSTLKPIADNGGRQPKQFVFKFVNFEMRTENASAVKRFLNSNY